MNVYYKGKIVKANLQRKVQYRQNKPHVYYKGQLYLLHTDAPMAYIILKEVP